jgi:low affinity Fe/Cu permease
MGAIFERFAQAVAAWAGRPIAFAAAFLIVVGWGFSGPVFGWSDTWQLVINTGTTIVTFLMVFLIQNAQNRDAAAIQAKLDEVIRALDNARNEFIGIEHLSEKELLAIRDRLEREWGGETAERHQSIGALLRRRGSAAP